MKLKHLIPRRRYSAVLLSAVGAIILASAISTADIQKFYSYVVSEAGASIEGAVSYGNHQRQKMDIYRHDNDDQSGPIAIFLYGGGWKTGQREFYQFVGTALASRGITTVIPDYRLYPEVKFPAFVDDIALAYNWVWEKFVKGRAEPRPIILIGHSAGAYMAAMVSLNQDYIGKTGLNVPPPSGFIGLAGPYAFDPTTWPTTKDIFALADAPAATKPITFARKDAPPSLLFHGLDDDTVRIWNTRSLARALSEYGARTRKVELPGLGHIGLVLALSRPFRWRAPILTEVMSFLNAFKTTGGDKIRADF